MHFSIFRSQRRIQLNRGVARIALLVGFVAAGAAMSTPSAAQAENKVDKVEGILGGAGTSGVVREPGSLDDAKKKQVEDLASALAAATGGRAYIVVLKKESDVDDFKNTYRNLGMARQDVLIVSNGAKWIFNCAAMSEADKKRLMKPIFEGSGNPLVRMRQLTDAIPSAIAGSQGAAKTGANTGRRRANNNATRSDRSAVAGDTSSSEGGFPFGLAFLGLLVVGGGGFVVMRRKQRDKRLGAEFKEALAPGENAIAEVFMGLDGIEDTPGFDGLLSSSTALQSEFDAVKAAPPTRQSIIQAQALSKRARELEGQMRALGGKGSAGLFGS
jgi:hypothetical protein